MEKKKEEVNNIFHNFFILHEQQKQEQHTKKTNIDFPSVNYKDLMNLTPNLPALKPKEELSKKLQRNDL
ncbi:MAG: hypothetical protein KKB39_01245 [Nanoarchaeota archaeon]|nr:hypothetical protein [Nanoarchaeota archaeon]MCG2719322.1 hypothetical protein [Nanoarchaeota archaeon]